MLLFTASSEMVNVLSLVYTDVLDNPRITQTDHHSELFAFDVHCYQRICTRRASGPWDCLSQCAFCTLFYRCHQLPRHNEYCPTLQPPSPGPQVQDILTIHTA